MDAHEAGVSGKALVSPEWGGGALMPTLIHPHLQDLSTQIKGGLEVPGRLGQCGPVPRGDFSEREEMAKQEEADAKFPRMPRTQGAEPPR